MLTHLDSQGRANMVDVTEKAVTEREATAEARVRMLPQTLQMIVDGEQVPLDMGREKRLFPPHLRKALYHRDQCCIKCGAPPGRTHAHHIVHVRREARVFRSEVKDLRYRAVTAA